MERDSPGQRDNDENTHRPHGSACHFALVLHAHARGGTFDKHGLGKGTVQGFIAGTHAVAPDRV